MMEEMFNMNNSTEKEMEIFQEEGEEEEGGEGGEGGGVCVWASKGVSD